MATHTVQEGETLAQIASKVHRSQASLHAANHGHIGSNPDNLAAGMILDIPEREAAAADDDDGGDAELNGGS